MIKYDKILDELREKDGVKIVASDPANASDGDMIINASTAEVKIFFDSVWHVLHTLTLSDKILTESGDWILQENGFGINL